MKGFDHKCWSTLKSGAQRRLGGCEEWDSISAGVAQRRAQMAKIALPIDPDAAHCDRTAQRQQARPLPKSGQHGPASDSKAKDDCQPGPAFERARCEEVFHGAVHAGQGAQLVPKASALARRRIGCPTGPALPAKWGRFRVS